MKVFLTASEAAPVAKVGGLADVVGALPKALKLLGIDVSIVLPFYECINLNKKILKLVKKKVPIFFDQKEQFFNLWKIMLPGSRVPLFLIEHKEYYAGKGVYVESDASSGGSEKEAARFLFLSAASIKVARMMKADILHCQDWHTAITPFLIRKQEINLKTLLTIHNLGYQGRYSNEIVNRILGTDFSEEVNCLKLGIMNSDFINTVSPSYAGEILTTEFGEGLEDYLKKRRNNLLGILNGIDTEAWNPEQDAFLAKNYSIADLEAKEINKAFLQKNCFGEAHSAIPVLGIVSRLAEQKGIDLIKEIFPKLMQENIQFILLGTGSPDYEEFFKEAAKKFPGKIWVKIGFDEQMAHQIYGGADIFLMPSRFEPCGLGQQIAMRYGTITAARAVGGIRDTVLPVENKDGKIKGTGFLFSEYKGEAFLKAIDNTLNLYLQRELWKKLQANCMEQDLSWEKSARKYIALYQKILG